MTLFIPLGFADVAGAAATGAVSLDRRHRCGPEQK